MQSLVLPVSPSCLSCVSPPVDIIVTGDEVLVLEEKQNEKGVTRVRFAKGWLSVTASDGSVILEGVE